MIDENLLSNLNDYQKNNYPVTSSYMTIPNDLGEKKKHLVKLKEKIKYKKSTSYFKELPENEKESVLEDFEKIHDWYNESFENQHYKSGLVFSSSKNGLWETVNLKVPVDNELSIQHKPYIRPLAKMLSDYKNFAVVLIDKAKTRIIENRFGEYVEHINEEYENIEDIKVGGFQGREERKHERHQHKEVVNHFKEAAQKIFEFDKQKNFHWIILGGRKEATSEFKNYLHNYVKKKVIGSVKLETSASINKIVDKITDLVEKARHEYEDKLINKFHEQNQKGKGASGFEEIFEAIRQGRIDHLLIPEQLRQKGVYCRYDNYLNTEVKEECPLCGNKLERTGDVVEHLIEKALNQSSNIHLIDKPLEGEDKIAATLRY